jgi:hypothetical protein
MAFDREEMGSLLRTARRNRLGGRRGRRVDMDFTQMPEDRLAALERAPEMRGAADDVEFESLISGIHDDPRGRGPVPAMSEAQISTPPVDDYDAVFNEREVAHREARFPQQTVPEAVPDNTPVPAQSEVAQPFRASSYARVAAPSGPDAVDAGPEPESEDDSLIHSIPGMLATGLALAGGNQGQAAEYGDRTAARAEGKRGERMEYGRYKAGLEREAADRFKADTRYAGEQNFERERAERGETRQGEMDAYNRGMLEEQRGYAREDRDPARQQAARDAEFGDWRRRADYEAMLRAKARRAAGGGGKGNLDARRMAAYDQGVQVLEAQGLQGQELEAAKLRLRQAVMTDDPEKSSLSLTGETGRVEQAQARDEAKVQIKAQESAAQRSQLKNELLEHKRKLLEYQASGSRYLPGLQPAAQKAKEFVLGGRGQAALFGDDSGRLGSTGYTQLEDSIANGGQLVARAEYYDRTHNSANLQSEAAVADKAYTNNGTVAGALSAVDRALAKINMSEREGYVRTDDGAIVPYSAQEQQAPGASGIEWDQ